MSTGSRSFSVIAVVMLLAAFAAGSLAGRALALPLPASVVGLAVVLLALRIGVMVAPLDEPSAAPTPPIRPSADASGPSLRAANG